LHDAWLLSGHCAHSFACQRWQTGCGACPDLNIPPAIQADGTAYNWSRKKSIYQRGRFHVATPCQWLMDKVQRSILAAGMVEARVIPYGVNLDIFRPGNPLTAREQLGLPAKASVIFFAANYVKTSYWKDFATMESKSASRPFNPIRRSWPAITRRLIFICMPPTLTHFPIQCWKPWPAACQSSPARSAGFPNRWTKV